MNRFNVAIAVAPALLLLWLFQRWDAKRPEPPGQVRNVVIFGALTCIPAGIIEVLETKLLGDEVVGFQGSFTNAFLIAAVTEETVKLLVVLIYLWKKPHFDEVMDGILYTAAASLGFALLENVLYSAANPVTGLVRAFTAVPLHAVASGIMGYSVGRAKFAKSGTVVWLAFGLMCAVAIHGTYDWALMSGGTFGFAKAEGGLIGLLEILPIVLVGGGVLRLLVRHAQKLDDVMLGDQPRPLPEPAPVQPAYAQPAYPGYGPPAYGAPAYPQPGYGQPAYGAPAYPQPGYGPPAYGQAPPPAGYPQPGYGQPPAGYGQPPAGYAQPAYAQPPAGDPQPPLGYGPPPAGYPQPQPQPYAPQPTQAAAPGTLPVAPTPGAPYPPGDPRGPGFGS